MPKSPSATRLPGGLHLPDWTWKALSVLVLPALVWGVGAEIRVQIMGDQIEQLEQQTEQLASSLEATSDALAAVNTSLEVIGVHLEYLSGVQLSAAGPTQ